MAAHFAHSVPTHFYSLLSAGTNIVAAIAAGWTIYKWDWQFSGGQALDEADRTCLEQRAVWKWAVRERIRQATSGTRPPSSVGPTKQRSR
ncbi:MAG: hypothetical protein ACREJ0_28645 [Geminicoccaceae bacterium]